MTYSLILNLSALAALAPASILPYRRAVVRPDMVFWAVMAAAVAGPAAYSLIHLSQAWETGLSSALWLSVAVSMALFALLALVTREAWRLMPLLLPYLLLLGALATIWSRVPGHTGLSADPDAWLILHIAVSVVTYALFTIAAVAGAAVFLQERAVKRKQPTSLTHKLPSISDAANLQVRLLAASEAVLFLGIATGIAKLYLSSGRVLDFDHKTLLSLIAFALIGLLLILHQRTGLRGQRIARLILVAYLLLTLAYPGVKFVTDILIG